MNESKLASRKLWITIGTIALILFAPQLGIPAAALGKAVGISTAYLLGQSLVDMEAKSKQPVNVIYRGENTAKREG